MANYFFTSSKVLVLVIKAIQVQKTFFLGKTQKSLNKKWGVFLVLVLIVFSSCSSLIRNKLTNKKFKNSEVRNLVEFEDFYWSNDTILGEHQTKVAMYLPVKLDGIEEKFVFQLDLGSSTTEIYGKSLDQIKSSYRDSLGYVWNLSIAINNSKGINKKIHVYKNLGGNERIMDYLKIGNLGHDYFQNKILVIDYINSKFLISNHLENSFYLDFKEVKNASIDKFPILIGAKLNNKKSNIMLDTGSGIFGFMTYPQKYNVLKGKEEKELEITKCCVKAFGKEYTISETSTSNTLEIFSQIINPLVITTTNKFDEDKQAERGMKLLNIDGITSNKFLLKNVIILDFKNNKLWLK